ncbi:MAG: hypothetical protein QM697_18855 [Lachnospiraceae bacterium]
MKIDINYVKGGRSRGSVSEVTEDQQSVPVYHFWVWRERIEIIVAFDVQNEPSKPSVRVQRQLQPMIVNEYVLLCMAQKRTFQRSAFLKSHIKAGLRIRTDAASRNLIDICVDGRRGADLYGRFYTLYAAEPFPFEGICSLFMQMEQVFDTLNFPASQTEHRRFNKTPNCFTTTQKWRNHLKGKSAKGRRATYIVKVAFRENATWQGTITWVEGQQEACFRSALELMRLIDSTAGTAEESAPENIVREQSEPYVHRL